MASSLRRLVRALQQGYAVVPVPTLTSAVADVLMPQVMLKRLWERRTQLLPDDQVAAVYIPISEIGYGIRVTKALISELKSLFSANQLHTAFAFKGPRPLFTFSLVTNYTGEAVRPVIKGLPREEDDFLPRPLREHREKTSHPVLQPRQKNNWLLNITIANEECVEEPEEDEKTAESLLAERKLGWASVGQDMDEHSLQLFPTLSEFEDLFRELLTLPLGTISTCPAVTWTGSAVMKFTEYQSVYQWALKQSQEVFISSLYGPLAMVAILREYEYLLINDQQKLLDSLINGHIGDYTGLSHELISLSEDLKIVRQNLPDTMQFGVIELNLMQFKRKVEKLGGRLVKRLLEEFQCEYSGLLHQAAQLFDDLMKDLRRNPSTVEELQDITDYLYRGKDTERFNEISDILQKAQDVQNTLEVFDQPLTVKQMENTWNTKMWLEDLRTARSRAQTRINRLRPAFIDQVTEQSTSVQKTLTETEQKMALFQSYDKLEDAETHADTATLIMDTLVQAAEQVKEINFRERVLNLMETDFIDFAVLKDGFSKYNSLWNFARDWLHASEEWNFSNFRQINGDAVSSKFSEGSELLEKLTVEFTDKPEALYIVRRLQTQMQDFQKYVMLIMQLRHPALRDRHWDAILAILGGGLRLESLTLSGLVQANILSHTPEINRVCHEAINEFEIERVLVAVESETTGYSLTLSYDPDFSRELPYLEGLDKAETLVKEQQTTITFIQNCSKYAGVFKTRLEKAKNILGNTGQVIKDVREFQSGWMKLFPLLQLQEVRMVMEREHEKARELQEFYMRQTEGIYSSQSVAVFSETKIKTHVEANELIETLMKEVEKLIKKKTVDCPRLLFLSTRELKFFLSTVARRGQVTLTPLYPGIGTVSLAGQQLKEVTHSTIPLPLHKSVTLEIGDADIRVENWLQDLDTALRITLQKLLEQFLVLAESDLNWWRECKDPQVLNTVQQLLFSQTVFTSTSLLDTIPVTMAGLKKLLQDLIFEVRPIFGTPGKSSFVLFKEEAALEKKMEMRNRLEKLVLLVLQQLHILKTALEDQSYDLDDLLWRTVVRLKTCDNSPSFDMNVTFFDYTKRFGFEWLPLPLPLFVSTPITDRCMLNLACALKNFTCGLLQGESGCSKSETLKELALLHGRPILSWSMAKGTQSLSMMSALAGCLATGTWMCFEEIQQMEPLLLNSLVFYLPKICEAQKEGAHQIYIDGMSVRVQEGFAFWAMSTQTKLQLPVRVLECFRCVALVQPDLAAVIEIRLYALGLASARDLSKRIARTLSFLSDDCSSIFREATSKRLRISTLKLMNKILNWATRILDQFTVTDTNYLFTNVFARVLKVGLSVSEESIFEEFLTTIFRAPHNAILDGTALKTESGKIMEVMKSLNFKWKDELTRTMCGLWNFVTDSDRRVILITGPPASGKTSLVKIVATAYSLYKTVSFNIHTLSGQTSPWDLCNLVYSCSFPSPDQQSTYSSEVIGTPGHVFTQQDWIYIDSAFLHSDTLLEIARNEVHLKQEMRLTPSKDLRVMTEVEGLETAAPNLIAEVSVVYCGEEDILDSTVFEHEVHLRLPQYESELMSLYSKHFENVIANLEEQILNVSKRVCLLLLCNWLCLFLSQKQNTRNLVMNYRLETGVQRNAKEEMVSNSVVQVAWVLSLIVCIGQISKSRLQFSESLLKLCRAEDPSFACHICSFVSKKQVASIFDLTFLFDRKTWITWASLTETEAPREHVPQMPSRSVLYIETESAKRLKHRIELATKARMDFIVMGPHQCGKTLLMSQVLRDLLSKELVSILPIHIFPSTSCDTVKRQLEEALDQCGPHYYGAVGDRHNFAFIEDMNLSSSAVYDDLRCYIEHKGWYSKGEFYRVSNTTFGLVQSYSQHRFRPLDQRALRHFLVLYKYQYTDPELQTIFTEIAGNQVYGHSLYTHYSRTRLDLCQSERNWQHSTLSNYIQASTWLKRTGLMECMMRRYFADQQLIDAKEPFSILKSLFGSGGESYEELTVEKCGELSERFERARSVCNEKYPEHMNFFNEPLISPEDQTARQLYHFVQVADDLQTGQHSIVLVERDLQTVRALTFMAAESLDIKVLPISLANLSSELINTMAEGQANYLATDTKFALKQMLDAAIFQQKTLCVVTLEDETSMKLPLLRNLLEFCSDLLLGKIMKSLGPIRKICEEELYPDQIKQVMRERMQENVVLTILVRTDTYAFDRSHREGPVEHLKHDYRELYNLCRLVNYDRQQLPAALMEFGKQKRSGANVALMKDLAQVRTKPLEEFALQQIWFLMDVTKRFDEELINAQISRYQRAIIRVSQIELELEKSAYILELQSKLESLKTQLKALAEEKLTLENLATDHSEVSQDMLSSIDTERRTFQEQVTESETRLLQATTNFANTASDVEKSEGNLVLLGALQKVLYPKSKAFPFSHPEKYTSHCKFILGKLATASTDVATKLQNLEGASLPDLSEFLTCYRKLGVDRSPISDLIEAMDAVRRSSVEFALKRTEWTEAPLLLQQELHKRNEIQKNLTSEQLVALSRTTESVATEVSEIEVKLQSVPGLRSKMGKIMNELKDLKPVWMSSMDSLDKRRSHLQGNALRKAVFLVASLNTDYQGRERVRERLKRVLATHNLSCDEEEEQGTVKSGVPISPFLRDSINACSLVWQLRLPYPVFVDPFSLAVELIEGKLEVIQFSIDVRKDFRLIKSISEGTSVLVLEPTESMLLILMPLLQHRCNNSIIAMRRGVEPSSSQVKINTQMVEVHQNFRLYLSLSGKPSAALSQIATVISLEPADSASWRASVLLQLLKINAAPSPIKVDSGGRDELLDFLAKDESTSIYANNFQPIFSLFAGKVEEKEAGQTKSRTESPVSIEGDRLQETYLELLSIASDLSAVLQIVKLGEWTISPPMFRSLLLNACEEQIKEQGFPSLDQIATITSPILYRFVVRLLWVLPNKCQNVLLLTYCLKRKCDEGLFTRTLRAVSKGLSLPYTFDNSELITRWETLKTWFSVPETLSWDSQELRNFLDKDLYVEASLPETIDCLTQAVLVCWFRQDLLPMFIETLVVQVLGRRFNFIPDIDFIMAAGFVSARTPLSLFFKKTYPLPWLKRATTVLVDTTLGYTTPLVPITRREYKPESKLEPLLKELDESVREKKWLVMEGLEILEKSEVERFSKHVSETLKTEGAHPDFRLWLLFQTSPKTIPAWNSFLKNTYRLCFREPKTVREHMLVAQELFDPQTFEVVSRKKKQMYLEYSKVDLPPVRNAGKRVTRINPMLRATVNTRLKTEIHRPSLDPMNLSYSQSRRPSSRAGSLITPAHSSIGTEIGEVQHGNISDFYFYNLTLIVSAFRLRFEFCKDLPIVLSLKEVKQTIQEVTDEYLSKGEENMKEQTYSLALLFLQLIGSSWDEIEFYAALNFIKHSIFTRSKALKFTFTDKSGVWSVLEYPLYKMFGNNTHTTIEALLFEMPKQDHLQLIGQSHHLSRQRQHERAVKIGAALPLAESLQDMQIAPMLQKLSELNSLVQQFVRPKARKEPVDFEALKVHLNPQELKRFSYIFVPDRFRTVDYTNWILTHPPSLSSVLLTLERINEETFNDFIHIIDAQLGRINGYLTYRTAQISVEDVETLAQLSRDRTPDSWMRMGPYSLRKEIHSGLYVNSVTRPLLSFPTMIDFAQVMDPHALLTTLFRASAFLLQVDIENVEFEVQEHGNKGLPEFSFLMDGLWLFNAVLIHQLLDENYSAPPSRLPVLRCTAVKKHKNSDTVSSTIPSGVVLNYRRTTNERIISEISKEEELTGLVNSAFNYQHTDWIENLRKRSVVKTMERLNKILCPVFPGDSCTQIWMVMQSDKAQGHWSKRAIKVDLP